MQFDTRLKKLDIDFPFMVAPMVALSHAALRKAVKRYTPKGLNVLCFTEMLSTRRLPSCSYVHTNEIRTYQGEFGMIPQLLGNEEGFIAESIERLKPLQPWGIDINMGCPVKHTLKHNWGVRLMGDIDYASDIVRMVKRHTDLPVSVKLRAGSKDQDESYIFDFTESLEKAGADWITIHGRSREQKHKGEADWGLVGRIQKARNIPVVGNGNIQTADDAISVIKDFGCDGAMVARAVTARPWIFWQIAHKLGYEEAPEGMQGLLPPMTPEEEGREYIKFIIQFAKDLDELFLMEDYKVDKFRFLMITNHKWFEWGHSLVRRLSSKKTMKDIIAELEEYQKNFSFILKSKINL